MNKYFNTISIAVGLVLFVLLFPSCNSGQPGSMIGVTQKTPNGFEFVLHREGEGRPAAVNDFVEFEYYLYTQNGQYINEKGSPTLNPVIRIPDPEMSGQINPFMETLIGRRAGDSLSVLIPTETLGPNYDMLKTMPYVKCNMEIKGVRNEMEHAAFSEKQVNERNEKANIAQQRKPGIAEFARNVLDQYNQGTLKTQQTPSGVEFVVHEVGQGRKLIQGTVVNVHYFGMTKDGKEFDSSFTGGEPLPVAAGTGGVIKGWDEVLSIFPKGTKATVFIPSDMAYGENGYGNLIPPGTDLVFYMEIENTY